ncbi:MAG: DNA polymerase thumb domain-containing protein [Alphaproteobacteria bacterium]|nr:MAG: impB/mucB/samB family protein [Alphaproteobacteria bacterium]|tara:strand:- start:1309 stop:2586 length:1278 start_codon:yes stop_codon:yes gene_type:complete
MNKILNNKMILNWLYLDLNSYFASVEQQLQPKLQNKPIAIVPTMTDATCAIAASYEAKAYGVKTGTMIYEAKKLCPEIICVQANHENYVRYHHKILEEIDKYIPIEIISSIDEVACKLIGSQKNESQARKIAKNIKIGIQENIGQYIRCSIGIAPNRFLAKTASNLEKPDGLQVLYSKDIPDRIKHFKLSDLTGIGRAMEYRLNKSGILSIQELYKISPKHMRKIWGNVQGEKFWYMLRGKEIADVKTERKTIGHSHVLEPKWRLVELAEKVMLRLLLKAASRLRRTDYYCSRLSLSIRTENNLRLEGKSRFYRACDNKKLQEEATKIWAQLIKERNFKQIKKISITLYNLKKKSDLQPELFQNFNKKITLDTNRFEELSKTMDNINTRFGRDSVTIGGLPNKIKSFSGTRIAFTRIPDKQEFNE